MICSACVRHTALSEFRCTWGRPECTKFPVPLTSSLGLPIVKPLTSPSLFISVVCRFDSCPALPYSLAQLYGRPWSHEASQTDSGWHRDKRLVVADAGVGGVQSIDTVWMPSGCWGWLQVQLLRSEGSLQSALRSGAPTSSLMRSTMLTLEPCWRQGTEAWSALSELNWRMGWCTYQHSALNTLLAVW